MYYTVRGIMATNDGGKEREGKNSLVEEERQHCKNFLHVLQDPIIIRK